MSDLDERLSELQEQIKAEREVLKLDERVEEVVEESVKESTKEEIKEEVKEHKGHMDRESYVRKYGSDEGYKDKETFDRDGSFFKKIEAQNKKIDELLEFNRQALEHTKKVERASYEKALRDLQMEKIELIRQADAEGVIAVEQKAAVVQEQIKAFEEPASKPAQQQLDAEAISFQERNSAWLNGSTVEDKRMQAMARAVITYLQETEPNISSKDAVTRIEDELKEKFPKKFESEYRNKPALVGTSTAGKDHNRSELASKLTKQQKEFVRKAKTYGSTLTEEEYAKQLALTGALRDE